MSFLINDILPNKKVPTKNFEIEPKYKKTIRILWPWDSCLLEAIGIRHTKVKQIAIGMMSGSVNTRDFNHHASA